MTALRGLRARLSGLLPGQAGPLDVRLFETVSLVARPAAQRSQRELTAVLPPSHES